MVTEFFNIHPKQFKLLSERIQQLLPSVRHKHLIDVCEICRVQRVDGLAVFIEVFVAVVDSLEAIKNNIGGSWNS